MSSEIQRLIGLSERRRAATKTAVLHIRVDRELLQELKVFLVEQDLEVSETFRVLVNAILDRNPGVIALLDEINRKRERPRVGPSLSKRELDSLYDAIEEE